MEISYRSDLDGPTLQLRRYQDRFVEIPGVDQEDPNKLRLCCDKRAVADGYLTVADLQSGGAAGKTFDGK